MPKYNPDDDELKDDGEVTPEGLIQWVKDCGGTFTYQRIEENHMNRVTKLPKLTNDVKVKPNPCREPERLS